MALLLVKTSIIDGLPGRYQDGDVLAVFSDDHVFGRMESLEVWIAEGRDPADWPGGFAIIRLTNLMPEIAAQWAAFAGSRKRDFRLDYLPLERRSAGSGRDTLRTLKTITRDFSEVSDCIGAK